MKKILSLLIVLTWMIIGCTPDPPTPPHGEEVTPPTVSTGGAEPTINTAVLNGTVVNNGGAEVTERGFFYYTSPSPEGNGTKITAGKGTGAFSAPVASLTQGTQYYFRAYAKNSKGIGYGNEQSFTTLSPVVTVPTITTVPVTGITNISIVSGGTISNNGNASITAKGFCWNQTGMPTIADAKTTDGNGDGSFTSTVTGLIPGTTYKGRSYATNSAGTAYGTEVSFSTTGFHEGQDLGFGIAVYIYSNADSALVASKEDLFPGAGLQWGCPSITVSGTSPNMLSGRTNTAAILAQCPSSPPAQACRNYTAGGKTWHWPSTSEMQKIYEMRNLPGLIGTFPDPVTPLWNRYWVSVSGSAPILAYYVGWGSGNSLTDSKNGTGGIRPITYIGK